MRKVLKNTLKTKEYLRNLPTLYLVGCWANCGVREYHFTGKYELDEYGTSIPLVYDYDDHNGTCDNWYLRRLDYVTTGKIIMWTQSPSLAFKIADLFNKEFKNDSNNENS
jgi:hypothetical protein